MRYSTIRYVHEPEINELSVQLGVLSNRRIILFRTKTPGLEMRIGKRKRFPRERVDVGGGGFRPVGKGFSPIAAGRNTFHTPSIDPVFSRASETT
ncbi:hypothetical protein [Burkholderia sp. LMG 21824]|uniref:hypothetical protein n=1 Tax=Burkholderia sp. LMG 21824 TaxID=3158172 RepID=UPI003C2E76EE